MLRTVTRHLRGLTTALVAAVALTGCYTMKTTTVYHADDTADFSGIIAFDTEMFEGEEMSPDDMVSEFEASISADGELEGRMTVEPYEEDGRMGVQFSIEGLTQSEMLDVMSDGDPSTPAANVIYLHTPGTITLSSEPADGMSLEPGTDPEELGLTSEMLGGFELEQRYTFPGPVQSTTVGRIDPADPTTVIVDDYAEASGYTSWTIVAADSADGAPAPTAEGAPSTDATDSESTPDPTAEPAQAAPESPSASPFPEAAEAAGPSSLWWLWGLGGLVLLAAAGTVTFLVIRARRPSTSQVAPAGYAPVGYGPAAQPNAAAAPMQTFTPEEPRRAEGGQPPAPQA